eukprot:3944418-Pyramimonas_sp.AAC.1
MEVSMNSTREVRTSSDSARPAGRMVYPTSPEKIVRARGREAAEDQVRLPSSGHAAVHQEAQDYRRRRRCTRSTRQTSTS